MEIDLAKSVWFHVSLLYFLGVCFVVSSLSMVLGLSVFVSASMGVGECLLKCLCAGVCLTIVPFYMSMCAFLIGGCMLVCGPFFLKT